MTINSYFQSEKMKQVLTKYLVTHRNSVSLFSNWKLGPGRPISFNSAGQSVLHTKLWLRELKATWSGKLERSALIASRANSTRKGSKVVKPSSNLSQRNWIIGIAWLTSQLSETPTTQYLENVSKFWIATCVILVACFRDLNPPLITMSEHRFNKFTIKCAFKLRYFISRAENTM